MVKNETTTLTCLLTEFSNLNPNSVVKTFIVDKDAAEIAAIKAVLPETNIILLCKFHVKNNFKDAKSKYDLANEGHIDKLRDRLATGEDVDSVGSENERCTRVQRCFFKTQTSLLRVHRRWKWSFVQNARITQNIRENKSKGHRCSPSKTQMCRL